MSTVIIVTRNPSDFDLFKSLVPLVSSHLNTLGVEHSRDTPEFLLRVYDTVREHKKVAKDAAEAASTTDSALVPINLPSTLPEAPLVPYIHIMPVVSPAALPALPAKTKRAKIQRRLSVNPLDIIYQIVTGEKGAIRLHDLKTKFTTAFGVDPIALLGSDWVVRIKNDTRLHCDGRLVFTKTSVIGTPSAVGVARYNIMALRLGAGVDSFIIGELCHLAGVCIACKTNIEYGECDCTHCHHPSHGRTSQKEYEWRMGNSLRHTRDAEHIARRRQALQIVKLLGVGQPEVHGEISHWLGICGDHLVCAFCE